MKFYFLSLFASLDKCFAFILRLLIYYSKRCNTYQGRNLHINFELYLIFWYFLHILSAFEAEIHMTKGKNNMIKVY